MKLTHRQTSCSEKNYRAIYEAHADDLYRYLYYRFGEENNPQDVVQEAFLKLWKNCETVPMEKARSFLFTVAHNQMINDLSRKNTRLKYRPADGHGNPETPEFILEEKQYFDQLKNALEELTDDQRTTFLLNRVEGKKHNEIAEILGISRKAVEKRIYKTLAILREKLGQI